jgi:hypothetical protein
VLGDSRVILLTPPCAFNVILRQMTLKTRAFPFAGGWTVNANRMAFRRIGARSASVHVGPLKVPLKLMAHACDIRLWRPAKSTPNPPGLAGAPTDLIIFGSIPPV